MRSQTISLAVSAFAVALVSVLGFARPAFAGSTGNLTGTVTDAKGAPVAGAHVSSTAPTGSYRSTTDGKGFFSIVNMSPDTYTVTVSAPGLNTEVITAVNIFQEQTLNINVTLQPEAKVLGRVTTTAQKTNLVQPNVTSDTYNVTAKQMNTILGDSTHHTLYDVLWRTPGITSGPTSNSPIIRGGTTTEVGWEFEEIPIVDRTVGFYVTELSTTGIGNVEVTTGGLSAQQGGSNGGIVNMVVKQGTYPPFGDATTSVGGPAYLHQLDTEYGNATADNKWSWFMAGSFTNGDNIYGKPGQFFFENVEGFDFVNTKDTIVNVHHHWGETNQNDLQYVADVGVGIFRTSYGGIQGQQLAENGVTFNPGAPSTECDPTNPFVQLDPNCVTVSLVPKLNADAWYHWYGIQKLSFSHTINDRSYYRARVAQSRNGYFFDEKWAQNVGEPGFGGETFGRGNFPGADLWCYGCYYQDRHTLQTFWNFDYANQLSSHHLIKVGTGYEFDTNYRAVSDCCTNLGWSFQWPAYDRVTQAPTHIYSAYASDHIAMGNWVFEPGVRWDMERYSISPVRLPNGQPVFGSALPFSESFTSPRFAVTYQPNATNVFRASYEHLGQFIGTAYAENFSSWAYFNSLQACVNPGAGNDPNCQSPAYSPQKPTTAKSYDMSWEHSFPNNVSLRISPYWHNNDNYVVEFQILHGPTVFTNGAATHTHGVEVGLSREVPAGLSAFFSLTYNDTKSNVLAAQGPYFGSFASSTLANIQANNFLPSTYAAPWSSNLALDWKGKEWEIDSNTTWATAFPYGAGNLAYGFDSSGKPVVQNGNSCSVTSNAGLVCLDAREVNSFAQSLRGPAWYNENLTISHSFGPGRIGITATNLFNDVTNPVPSANFNYLDTSPGNVWTPTGRCGTPQDYTSCFDTYLPAKNGVYYPANGYYQQQSLQPRQVNFWWKISM